MSKTGIRAAVVGLSAAAAILLFLLATGFFTGTDGSGDGGTTVGRRGEEPPPSDPTLTGHAPPPLASGECAWFAEWKSAAPSQPGCEAVASAMRPLTSSRAACMPSRWIRGLLKEHCRGTLELSVEEGRMLAAALPKDVAEKGHEFAEDEAEHAVNLCVLELLATGSGSRSSGVWARHLTAAGDALPGGLLTANAGLVDVAGALLGAHPISDVEWWRRLLLEMPDRHGAAHARRALYEAVLKAVPPEARLETLRVFAGLEDASTANGSFGIVAMGQTMKGLISPADALTAMATDPDVNWRRAVLWAQDPSVLWPYRKEGPSPEIGRALTDLLLMTARDDGTKYFRLDLVGQAWGVLGPELAAADLERYSRTAFGPSRETALRLAGAASVISQRGNLSDAGTQQAFDSAEQSLERLLQTSGGDLDKVLEQALRFGSMESREARDVVIRLLGERVRDVRKDLYDELVR